MREEKRKEKREKRKKKKEKRKKKKEKEKKEKRKREKRKTLRASFTILCLWSKGTPIFFFFFFFFFFSFNIDIFLLDFFVHVPQKGITLTFKRVGDNHNGKFRSTPIRFIHSELKKQTNKKDSECIPSFFLSFSVFSLFIFLSSFSFLSYHNRSSNFLSQYNFQMVASDLCHDDEQKTFGKTKKKFFFFFFFFFWERFARRVA